MAEIMICPLGLICESGCPNVNACYQWVKPWPLPYAYDSESRTLTIIIGWLGNSQSIGLHFEDFDFDIHGEWAKHGFADAVKLPYLFVPRASEQYPNGLYVNTTVPESGFHSPSKLPYQYSQLPDGTWLLEVTYSNYPESVLAGWVEAQLLADEVPF